MNQPNPLPCCRNRKKPVASAGFRVVLIGGDITSLPGRLDAIYDLGRKRHLADKLSPRVLKAHSLNVLQILTISDNGRGFQVPASPAELAPSGHFGLLGLHERAELIGAHLDIQSSPGQGTLVVVQLPPSKPSAQ